MCACMSQRPGMTNLPWPSTIRAPPRGALFWATLTIVLPRIVTVLFGTIRPSTTSMTFTRVIARACVWGATETAVMNVAASESKQIVALRSTTKLLHGDDAAIATGYQHTAD